MTKASDNIYPSMLYAEGTAPANPSAGQQRLFVRSSDHVLCMVNSSGTVTPLSGALVNPMTTKGDVILGDTGGAPTRLAASTSGYVLTAQGAGAFPVWAAAAAGGLASGASMPAQPAFGNNVPFFRTDLGLIFYYDGTRWLTSQIFEAMATTSLSGISAGASLTMYPPFGGSYGLWLVDWRWIYNVGATHDASNYWTAVLHAFTQGGSDTSVSTLTSDKSSASTWINPAPTALGSLFATTVTLMYLQFNKTNTPGNLIAGAACRYRLIGV